MTSTSLRTATLWGLRPRTPSPSGSLAVARPERAHTEETR